MSVGAPIRVRPRGAAVAAMAGTAGSLAAGAACWGTGIFIDVRPRRKRRRRCPGRPHGHGRAARPAAAQWGFSFLPLSHGGRLSMLRFSRMRRAGLCLLMLAAAGAASAAQDKPLRIAVIPSVANEATEIAIAQARKQGLRVELVEFSDWVMPNIAVAEGSVDANFFQHEPFLQLFNRSRNTNLEPIAYGYSTTIGLFSKRLKRG